MTLQPHFLEPAEAADSSFRVHSRAAGKKPRRSPRPRSGKVQVPDVHPLAWAKALELADGDVRRLQVVDYNTVITWNNPRSA